MLAAHGPSSGLVDRVKERDALDRFVAGVRAGQSRVLVLRGEAGVGKTALLRHLSGAAEGCRIARAAGVESEMELAFAGLHALCSPMLDRLGRLPGPQRDALNTAFGMSAGPPPDRFLVGLAVLSLMAEVAEEQPLVCVVVEGLAAADARRLLDATIPGRLDARVRDRILGEAGGNPLALLELPRGRTP